MLKGLDLKKTKMTGLKDWRGLKVLKGLGVRGISGAALGEWIGP